MKDASDPGDIEGRSPATRAAGRRPPALRMEALRSVRWAAEASPLPEAASLDIAGAWSLLVKNAAVIFAGLAAGLAIAAAVTLLTPPSYTAGATLQIDRDAEKIFGSEAQTPADNFGDEFFETQYGLLKSRALAARVAESLGLSGDPGFVKTMSGGRNGATGAPVTVERRREAVIDLLRGGEGVAPQRGSRLVQVNFSSPDPILSARVANAFAENFIGAAIDRRFEASSYARDFLEKRLAQVKARLEDSERQLVAYASSQQIIQLPNAGQPNANEAGPSLASADLEAFNSALAAARTERIRAEQKWRQAQTTTGVGLPDILESPTFQTLSQEHAKLSAQYQQLLRVYKPDYPDMVQLKAQLDENQRQTDAEAVNIRAALQSRYEAALANETALVGQVNNLKGAVLDLRGRSIRYTILQREVDTNRTLYDGLLQRYKEVGVAGGVATNTISIVDRAEPPMTPSQPKPLLNMALGGFGGLVLGLAMAFAREAFDQTIREPTDLETDAALPLLGAIPRLKRAVEPRAALADPRSAIAEAYHSLRSALQFSTADGLPRTLLVTSPWPGGGKTTTAFAIAQYVARLGFRVLLIDGDLRNPSVRDWLDLEGDVGLSSLLTGGATLKSATQGTRYPNLFAIAAGPMAPNPAELLAGSRLPLLIAEARAHFDMIVVDGAPVMGLADAPIVGSVVAGCLLVVEAGVTTRVQVRESLGRMEAAGAHMLGAVLTKYKAAHRAHGYGYEYAYGYDHGHAQAIAGRRRPSTLASWLATARRLMSR